jgi:ABC-type transport system involved in multi-copper enzyme maturation permease subunit
MNSAIILHFYAFLGAILLYILNKQQKKQPLSLFSALNVDIANTNFCIALLDMVLSCVLGSFAVVALTAPTTFAQALTAGLGMTGLLSVSTKDISKEDNS